MQKEKKRIAILGANESITKLIEKAKQMGYETHVFAWRCGDPGEKEADFFYPISIENKEEILEQCRFLQVEGVCSITSDFAAPIVSFIARNLNLVCNPARTEIVARDKYKMREALRNAGLYTPFFFRVSNLGEASNVQPPSFPVIVKPTDRWSSKGVTRVDSPKGLLSAISYAISESLSGSAIIESYIDGQEYSAECICWRGNYRILALTEKQTTGFPHYIETGHKQPAAIPHDKIKKIKNAVAQGLKALDIQNGAAHVEFKLTNSGDIGIIEIGARMGGDCIGTDLTCISTGMDYVGMVVDVACGNEPCFDIVSNPKPVFVRFIINQDDYVQYQHYIAEKSQYLVRSSITDTAFEAEVTDSSTRHGYYIALQG